MCLHVEWRDKVEDHVIALLYVDVPHTLRIVGVAAGVVGTGDQTRFVVEQTSTPYSNKEKNFDFLFCGIIMVRMKFDVIWESFICTSYDISLL